MISRLSHIFQTISILKAFCILVLFIGTHQFVFAQKNLKKADELIATQQYQQALDLCFQYEASLPDSLQKHPVLIKIATCFYEMNNSVKAAYYYSLAIAIRDNLPENLKLNYINSLIETAQYEKAKNYLLSIDEGIYLENILIAICDYALENQSIDIEVSLNPISTQYGNAVNGMTILGNKLLYMVPHSVVEPDKSICYLYDYNAGYNIEYELDNKYLKNVSYYTPSFENNGQRLYFSKNLSDKNKYLDSNREELKIGVGGSNNLGIFILDLTDPKGKSKPEVFPYINIDFNSTHPFITKDGKTLYFAADIPGGYGGYDIYSSEKTSEGWGRPVNLGSKVNTLMDEGYPYFNNGILYFSSKGHPGYGGLDIFSFVPHSAKVNNLGKPINSSFDDFYFMLKDEKSGFLISNRNCKNGRDIIYEFEEFPSTK